ncbi:MAG: sugar phosphate isomerase/epimerase, partial [Pseudomonadota bacterium]
MLLGFNLLLWTTHVAVEHFPVFETLKKTGYDGIELPLFDGTPEHYAAVGKAARDNGLRIIGVCVIPDEAHSCMSSDQGVQNAAFDHVKWAVDCLDAAGGELLCGPFYHPLGEFSGEPPTVIEKANLITVHQRAAEYAASKNIKLAVEPLNRFECYALNTVA